MRSRTRRTVVQLGVEPLEDRSLPAPFTAGNLVVYRVGDGGELNSAAAPVFLDEYTPAGALVQSVPMPTSAGGGNNQLVASGALTLGATEGLLTRSADGRHLLLTGYAAAVGTPSLVMTSSGSVPRVVGRVDHDGTIDTTTALTEFASRNSPVGVASTNGTDLWVTASNGGVQYTTLGATLTTSVSDTPGNLRGVAVFDGQLYVSTAILASPFRIGAVGVGTPTTGGQTTTGLPGVPTTINPNAFFFADLSATVPGVDTLYVADSTNGSGSVRKYTFDGTTWNFFGSTGGPHTYQGLTGVASGSTVTLFATRLATELVKIVDASGFEGTLTAAPESLASTATAAFRGVALAPVRPQAGTPSVTNAATDEDTQTTSGLVITASATDGGATTHYRITNITNGSLFHSDGVTPIGNHDFITKEAGAAGLRFTPDKDFSGTGSFQVQASTDDANGLGGDVVTATITVNPVNDGPDLRLAGTIFYEAGDPAAVIDPDATAADVDSTAFGTLTVEFTANGTADDRLAIRDEGSGAGQIGVSGSEVTFGGTPIGTFVGGGGAEPLVVTFNANATAAAVEALVRNVTFQNVSATPARTIRTVRFTLTDDAGGAGRRPTANVALTDPVFINEVLFNPPGDELVNEFVELRGLPGATIPAGTYLVGVDGNPDQPGEVRTVFDLSGLAFGGNGYLVFLQSGTPYTADPAAAVVTGTTTGFGGIPGFAGKFGNEIEHESVSFLVIQSEAAPVIDDDIDADDDGTPDGSVFAGWTVLDSVGVTSADTTGFRSYAAITFAAFPEAATAPGAVVETGFTAGYVGRNGESTGSAATDWVASRFFSGTAPDFALDDSATFPAEFAGLPLDHVGSLNFVNAPPVNTVPGPQTVDEDTPLVFSAAGGNAISVADPDLGDEVIPVSLSAAGGTITLSTTANLTVAGDGTDSVVILGALADINAALDGLTFTPAAGFSGAASLTVLSNDLGFSGPGGALFDEDVIAITVNPVADTPGVTGATTDEDTQAGGLVVSRNAADGDEVTHVRVTNVRNGTLFHGDGVTPVADGEFVTFAQAAALRFTPDADENDLTSTFGFDVQAAPGTSGAGLSAAVAVVVTVNPVNDAPTFAPGAGHTSDEDAGPQAVGGFVSDFRPGPSTATDEAGQTASYTVTVAGTTGTLAFAVAPVIDSAGNLTYTAAPDTNGTATVEVAVSDSGSGDPPSVNTSAAQTFTITVNAVNDEPSVALATGAITVDQDGGAFSRPGFAAFTPGGGSDEAGQTPTYTLTSTNPALFSVQPAIDAAGTLTFTPAPGAFGTATVTVNVTDDGPGTPPDDNAGAPRQFTITVEVGVIAPFPPAPPPPGQPTIPGARFIAIGSEARTPARALLLDARTRTVVREVAPFDGYSGGVRVALGDVNADGTPDLIAATATGVGHVKVFDGVTGTLLHSFLPFGANPSGLHVASADVDGDGADDIVAAVDAGSSHVMVFGGPTGAVLHSFLAYPGFAGGVRVAAGDATGDGRADVLAVAGPGGNGHVKVFDGAGGAPVVSFLGYVGYAGEINLAAGDLTRDGVAEVITVARNPAAGTHVKAFSGRSGAAARSFFAPAAPGVAFGSLRDARVPVVVGQAATVAAGDVNGDGVADIVLGDPPGAGPSELVIVNGATQAAVETRLAFDPLFEFGIYVDVE